jgi:hypothetical protein
LWLIVVVVVGCEVSENEACGGQFIRTPECLALGFGCRPISDY